MCWLPHHAKLQPRRLAHHFAAPGRIPYKSHLSFIDTVDRQQFRTRFLCDEHSHAAARSSNRHVDFKPESSIGQLDRLARIHEAQVDDIYGDFWVVACSQLLPCRLKNRFARKVGITNALLGFAFDGFDAQCVGVAPFYTIEVTAGEHGETTTQLLSDAHGRALTQRRLGTPRNLDRLAIS